MSGPPPLPETPLPIRNPLAAIVAVSLAVATGCTTNTPDPTVSGNEIQPAGNLLVNGGFENGGFSPWVSSIHAGQEVFLFDYDSTIRQEGVHSLRITSVDGGPWGVVTQDVVIPSSPAGSKLRLTFQMRAVETATAGEAHILFKGPGSRKLETFALEHPSSDYEWRLLEWELPLPERTARLELGITHNGAGTVWIDDIQLHVIPD